MRSHDVMIIGTTFLHSDEIRMKQKCLEKSARTIPEEGM